MRRSVIFVAATLAAFAFIVPAQAALNDFNGDWENADRNTRGITRLQIAVRGANMTIQAWGACTPQECNWGAVQGTPYSASVSEDMTRRTRAVTAVFNPAHAQTILVVTQAGRNKLRVDAYTHFKSGGRNNYLQTYTMLRSRPSAQAPAPAPTPAPTPTPEPQPTLASEDCIAFRPNKAQARQVGGRWKVTVGNMSLLDFGNKMGQAQRAMLIIKKYGLNKQCFVGRPNPSMEYYLVGSRAPAGAMRGEDCIAFNLRNTQARQVQGSWKIVDGNNWLLDFGSNQAEAQQAHAIMNKYGFSRVCYVGRPNPPMTYFRR